MKSDKEYLNSIQNKYGKAKALRRRRINTVVSVCMCLSLAVMISVVMINGGLFAQVTGYNGLTAGRDVQNETKDIAEADSASGYDTTLSMPEKAQLSEDPAAQYAPSAAVDNTGATLLDGEDRSASENVTEYVSRAADSSEEGSRQTYQTGYDGLTAAIVAAAAAVIIAGIVLLIANNLKRKD